MEDRSIEQLQGKYKKLKQLARTVSSNVKRDLAQTGNKALLPSTTAALQSSTALLSLRARMGPAAAGFSSKHCKYKSIARFRMHYNLDTHFFISFSSH